jgi:DNA-binding protein YbaB
MQNDKFLFLDCIFTFAKKQSSMFGDMMGKLKDAQKSAEETKVRMNSVMVSDDAAGGAIRITASANKEIKEIEISDALMQDKEELIDLLIVALNKTLKKAGEVQEKEMQTSMKENMPNIPGLNL